MIIALRIKINPLNCLRRSPRLARVESLSFDCRVVIGPERFDLLLPPLLLPEEDLRGRRLVLLAFCEDSDLFGEETRRLRRTLLRAGEG
jgi:hypothetical protein